jgi:hypothetical protein
MERAPRNPGVKGFTSEGGRLVPVNTEKMKTQTRKTRQNVVF